jgi:hypothetical protein
MSIQHFIDRPSVESLSLKFSKAKYQNAQRVESIDFESLKISQKRKIMKLNLDEKENSMHMEALLRWVGNKKE